MKKPTISWTKTDRAYQYALSVTSGKVLAGQYVRGACKRHINDVKKSIKDQGYRFYFDYQDAAKTIRFFEELLLLSGGQYQGKPFLLLDWESFLIGSLFGWKRKPWINDDHNKINDRCRRFRVAYIETPKGSGKSPLAAGVGLKGQVADKEPSAEIYAAATKHSQAMVLFGDAVAFYDQSARLQKRLTASGRHDNRHKLYDDKTKSVFKAVSSERKGLSGPRPHMLLLDEIHEHPDGRVIEMLRAGFKFRLQPLSFMITNAGYDKTSVCYEYHELGCRVACEQEHNDEFFSYVCSLDESDIEDDKHLTDESLWPKVNPSIAYGLPGYDYIRQQIKEARGIPSKMSTVKRLCFCQWVEAANPWIDAEVWFACQDDAFDRELLKGRRCWGGLDLSRVNDLTAAAFVFEPSEADPVWRLVVYFWIPGLNLQRKIDQDHVPYDVWLNKEHIIAPPTRMVKKSYVVRQLQQVSEDFDLIGIAYDRAMVNDLFQAAEDEGVELSEGKWNKEEKFWDFKKSDGIKIMPFGQEAKSMHPAIEKFECWLKEKEVRHDGNPCMTWCAANAVVKEVDSYRRLSKKESTGKIDGIIAAVMACGVADLNAVEKRSAYDGMSVDEMMERMAL